MSSLPAGLDAAMSDDDLKALPDKLGAQIVAGEVCHLTDIHHAMSYLDEVARLCEPEGDPHNMKLWYRSVLLHDAKGIDVVLRHLRYRLKTLPTGSPLTAVNKAFKYLHKRRKTRRCADVAKRGLPVGSGATESACGLFQLSVKRPGAAWGVPGLGGVMTLRGLVLLDRWPSAWTEYTAPRRRRVTHARKPHRAHPQLIPLLDAGHGSSAPVDDRPWGFARTCRRRCANSQMRRARIRKELTGPSAPRRCSSAMACAPAATRSRVLRTRRQRRRHKPHRRRNSVCSSGEHEGALQASSAHAR